MMSRPLPIVGFDPFQAPGWVQFYLDCVDGCMAQGVGGRDCALTLFRGGAVVGEVVIQVPDGAERELPEQRK
jgi:hypothetical protein